MSDTLTSPGPGPGPAPRPSASEARRRLAVELSLPARLGHTLLLVAALGGAGVAGALLATEPALPTRTRLAFAGMIVVGLAWAGYAAWVLTRRRVLLAGHRVVAARIAVAFAALYTAAALAAGWWGGVDAPGAYAAAGVGALMLAAAGALLVRARRRVRELTLRRDALERRLGASGRAAP